jgi:hypothetical protein
MFDAGWRLLKILMPRTPYDQRHSDALASNQVLKMRPMERSENPARLFVERCR